MKKELLVLSFSLFVSNSLFSQEPTWFLSGDIGFNYSTTNFNKSIPSNDNFLINFNPNIGYYIIDNLVAGLGIQLYNSNNNSPNSVITLQKSSQIFLSPFLRYYFENKLFGQIQMNIGSIHYETGYNSNYVNSSVPLNSQGDISAFGLGLGLGYAFKAGEHFKIEPLVKYYYVKDNYDKSSLITTTGGFTFNVGFSYSL